MWGGHPKGFPRAVLHVDGDSFFVACEVAKDPTLKGKYVVTGKERGIASALSYEAKARGAKRGMQLSEIRKLCPGLIVLPSDYETYSLYSERMYSIVKRYTPEVEEYSIDECFADLTGLRRSLRMTYPDMAERIKHDLDTELGITFSVGLSVNKVLSKVASKWRKPSGLTFIRSDAILNYLKDLHPGKIWGIGPNTSSALERWGVKTALQFAEQTKDWVRARFPKPTQELHEELNGEFVYPLIIGHKETYASISKTKTFTPASNDKSFIFSQLSKNIENACIKLRRHELFAKKIFFFLKTQEFKYHGLEITLSHPVCIPQEVVSAVHKYFDKVYRPKTLYRATGVVLSDISESDTVTLDLFGSINREAQVFEKVIRVYDAVDRLDEKYGKHTVFLASSLTAMTHSQHSGDRGDKSERNKNLFKGETKRKRLGLPFMGNVN
jgi:nucleotidyltransferase/DNA polymerase involved in DNA repair